ncbi:aldose 1-epimerase [bacterium A37T11]|nr:aldose 1-epimerase [bacterium A37T11]
MEVDVINYGARITRILVPDNTGKGTDVILGFNNPKAYLEAYEQYHGATIGRFANRISAGQFQLHGQTYHIKPNNGKNALHGGKSGFHARTWEVKNVEKGQAAFYYQSLDGEEGFPGNLSVWVTYTLSEDNELNIAFRANTDKTTVINLTNHAYFNLNGEGSGSILDHQLQIQADSFLPVGLDQIPTGELKKVQGTPFDFREARPIGSKIQMPDDQLTIGHGYDHNYVLPTGRDNDQPIASVWSAKTGIRMDVFTTEPGVQFYTANFLNGKDLGKSGRPYEKQEAFCLETQHFPNSPNEPSFPTTELAPGNTFLSQTSFKFSIQPIK